MDVSAFDFGPDELSQLLIELATVTKKVDVEPRLHQEDEMARTAEGWVKMHEGLVGPTFRIRCVLRPGDLVLEKFTPLMSALCISSVIDPNGWVRVRHKQGEATAS